MTLEGRGRRGGWKGRRKGLGVMVTCQSYPWGWHCKEGRVGVECRSGGAWGWGSVNRNIYTVGEGRSKLFIFTKLTYRSV